MYLLLYFQSDDFSGKSIFFTEFLNVCNATQVHKRFSTNAQRMHHRCTKDVQWKHQRCTLDAQYASNTLWLPHECFTDAPRILLRCTMNALRLSTNVSRAPRMDVPWIQYACTAYAEAGSLSLDNLVYLSVCLVSS